MNKIVRIIECIMIVLGVAFCICLLMDIFVIDEVPHIFCSKDGVIYTIERYNKTII